MPGNRVRVRRIVLTSLTEGEFEQMRLSPAFGFVPDLLIEKASHPPGYGASLQFDDEGPGLGVATLGEGGLHSRLHALPEDFGIVRGQIGPSILAQSPIELEEGLMDDAAPIQRRNAFSGLVQSEVVRAEVVERTVGKGLQLRHAEGGLCGPEVL